MKIVVEIYASRCCYHMGKDQRTGVICVLSIRGHCFEKIERKKNNLRLLSTAVVNGTISINFSVTLLVHLYIQQPCSVEVSSVMFLQHVCIF